jgi:hypothetical protein
VSHEPAIHAKGSEERVVDASASTLMLDLIDGLRISRLVWAAARLGIPDLLRDRAKSSDELAAETRTNASALARALRALVTVGLLAQDEQDRFMLTALGATLRSDVPGSLHPWALVALGDESYRAWGELHYSLRTGETAFEHVFGMDVWEYRKRHPEHGRLFDAAMASLLASTDAALASAYSFADVKRLVDVGGGDATLLIALLRAHPKLEGLLFDLPDVAANARQRIAAAGLAERCAIAAGDALISAPDGGDCYLLSRVIHDWDDECATVILRNCRRALPEHGALLVFERIYPARAEPSRAARAAALTDLTMLVATGGHERTEAQYRALVSAAGLDTVRIIPTVSGLSLIECRHSRMLR